MGTGKEEKRKPPGVATARELRSKVEQSRITPTTWSVGAGDNRMAPRRQTTAKAHFTRQPSEKL
jgi:hypothetical protein